MTTTEFQAIRASLGMTSRQLADALGLSERGDQTVRRIEAGGTITGPMALAMRKLADDAGKGER